MRLARSIVPIVLSLLLPGCGGDGLKRVPVKGKVTAGGVPVDHCTVQFLPLGSTPGQGGLGGTDREGKYTASSGAIPGLPPGEYKIRLSREVAPDGTPVVTREQLMVNPQVRDSIPAKYSGTGSPLKFTVPDSGGVIDIDIPEKLLSYR